MWRHVARCAAGLLLVVGAVVALTKLDLARYRCDAERIKKLAHVPLPSVDSRNPIECADWPQWRGPQHDGLSLESGLSHHWSADGPPLLWKRPLGRGFSSVAVIAGRLYTMDEEAEGAERHEAVVCLDAATGKEIWRFRYPNQYEERLGSGPRSTPAVDGNFVYAVGPTGIFHCLRADTGEKVWRHELMEEFHSQKMQYGVSFSPLVEGDLVYAMPGGRQGNSVAAFDKRTGELAWKALDDPVGYSSPIASSAAGVRQVLFFTNLALVSVSPVDGKELWRYPFETDNGFNIATPLAFGNYVLISAAYGKGCALLEITAEADGALKPHCVYEHNRLRNYFSSSVRCGEYIYGFDMMDLVCMKIRTGEIVWREKGIRTFRKGSLLIAEGQLIFLGEFGTLTLADATPLGYHEKAAVRVSNNKCWTVPVLANGKLYIRDESHLICFKLQQ